MDNRGQVKDKFQELINQLILKCWEDEKFKQRLIQYPIETIETILGSKPILRGGKKLVVVDQSDSQHIYLNIPAKPTYDDVELTEDELEIIAGGGNLPPIVNI